MLLGIEWWGGTRNHATNKKVMKLQDIFSLKIAKKHSFFNCQSVKSKKKFPAPSGTRTTSQGELNGGVAQEIVQQIKKL